MNNLKKYSLLVLSEAIDDEIERLKPLVELGGYIPCPDHRIAPDAKWENVQYYCDKMRNTFK
jgi:uroporphyrinogen decarboxylase